MKKVLIPILIIILVSIIQADEKSKQIPTSLKEAIYQALKNNLNLQVEMTNADYYWNSLKINNAIFVPSFNVNFDYTETNTPSTSVFAGAKINTVKDLSLSVALSQKIALGGTLRVELDNRRYKTNSIYSTVNPSLNSVLTFSLTQPLMKNFGTFSTKKDIYIAANEYKKSQHTLKENIINLIFNVEEAYWNLIYSHKNLEAKKKALERSKGLLRQNEIKVKVGTAAPIDLLEAKADVASYESQLIQAEQAIQTAEENLKKILNMSKTNDTIIPSEQPKIKKINANLAEFLLEALQKRPDIEKARLDLKNYNIHVKYARNQMLPDLQLNVSYYTTGQGGDQLIFDQNPFFGGQVIAVIEKDIWKTMKDTVSNLYRNYSVGLQLTVPLSFSKEKAELAQAKVNMKKALLNLKNIENTIYSEVKEIIKELQTNLKLVEANKISLQLEEQKLKAEMKKLSVGLSTNFQVLTYQRQYSEAQSNALKSVIDYNLTLARINKILARTFKSYRIKFKEFLKH